MVNRTGKWRQITSYADMQSLANAGVLVVGVLHEACSGDVLAVAPGQMKYSGNYVMPNGKLDPIQKSAGLFPLSLSTSKGSWPGAMSNGDKTVRDAFSAVQFRNVTFWAPQ